MMAAARMTDVPHEMTRLGPQEYAQGSAQGSAQDWLLAIATALVALLVLGFVPRLLG
jgi:hypothetical protein